MDEGSSFAEAVLLAKQKGFTEPDPRLDLGGVDVARKLLILSREAGDQMEMMDIENIGFLPKAAFDGTKEEFMLNLKKWGSALQQEFDDAKRSGLRMRLIASWEAGSCRIEMQKLSVDHPFYGLKHSDNALAIKTQRYAEKPLVIQGSGAGAELTASGVFSDMYTLLPAK
jgi:aspartokinase/homoserine dehydrogenase 1